MKDEGSDAVECYVMGEVVGDIAGESSGWRRSRGSVLSFAGLIPTLCAGPAGFLSIAGGVIPSLSSSGIVGQYVLRTCLSAGRRIGFERKKSMPESRHS